MSEQRSESHPPWCNREGCYGEAGWHPKTTELAVHIGYLVTEGEYAVWLLERTELEDDGLVVHGPEAYFSVKGDNSKQELTAVELRELAGVLVRAADAFDKITRQTAG